MHQRAFDHYRTGIAHLDDEHQQIFELIDTIKRACKSGDKERAFEALTQLRASLPEHMKKEEELMEKTGFPYMKYHCEHHGVVNAALKKLYEHFPVHSDEHVTSVLSEVVINHIDHYDLQYGAWVREQKARKAWAQ